MVTTRLDEEQADGVHRRAAHADVLARLHRAVPATFADSCTVWLLQGDDDDAAFTLVAANTSSETLAGELARATASAGPRHREASLLGRAARSGQPVLLTGEQAREAVAAPFSEMLRRWPVTSLAVVPMLVRDDVLGALVLTRREPSPPFSEDDVDYLKSLSERLALLLDNAALLDDAARVLAELGASKSFYSALLAHATDMVTIIDGAGAVRWASPSASRVLGYSPEEFLGHDNLNLVHPDDRARVAVRLGEMLAGGRHGETDRFRMRRKDGSWCWVETSVSDARQDPAVRGIVVNARDVTEEVNSRREVEERSRGQQEVLDSMPMSTALLDAEGTVVATNAAWRGFATRNGGSQDCGHHQNYFAVCLAAGDPLSLQVHDGLRAVLRSEVPEFTLVLPCPSPTSDRWYQMHIAPLTAGGGGAVVYYVDITKNKQYAAEMAHRAAHDYLTGLPNRVALVAALRDALVSHEGRESGLAVLFCDLDQFKLVNDSYGHEAGDEVLIDVAERLRRVAGEQHVVARFAGDEFVMVCRELPGPAAAIGLAEQVTQAMSEPFTAQGRRLSLSTSVGIALGSDSAVSSALLLRDADAALYEAKARGRARYAVFDATLQGRSERRLDLMQALPAALASGELTVHYQQLVDLRTLEPYGAEALLRWHRPGYGPVSPLEFIPVAEDNGFILELGRFVLEQACTAAAAWQEGPALQVSVNLSARQILADDIVALVGDTLCRTGLSPDKLCLEITESQLMEDPDRARTVLSGLRALGVSLAMDDFGTGYSSLAYLKRFPVGTLKVDRSFVAGVADDADDAAIVAAVTALARALTLTTVAEGVETEEQAEALRRLGCDRAQGYLFARPAPLAEFLEGLPRG